MVFIINIFIFVCMSFSLGKEMFSINIKSKCNIILENKLNWAVTNYSIFKVGSKVYFFQSK